MKQIKNITSILLFLFLATSCGTPLEVSEAKKAVDQYIELLNDQNYEEVLNVSSGDFSTDALKASSIDKMKVLHDKLGKTITYNLSDSLTSEEFAQTTNIQLTYKVKHKNVNTEETIIITKELAKCKVYKHVITNQW